MKKSYSPHWKSSRQPRKQRKYRANAPLHVRRKMLSAHLAKDLRAAYKVRAVPLRKGDEVRVMNGKFRRRFGKVEEVDLSSMKVSVEGIKIKKANGQEMAAWMEPSNLLITKLYLDDKKRVIRRKK